MKQAQATTVAVAALVIVLGLIGGYAIIKDRATNGMNATANDGGTSIETNTTLAQTPAPGAPKVSASLSAAPTSDGGFTFTCTANGITPAAYTWNFGDGTAPILSTEESVYYHYDLPGTYKVTCTAATATNVANGSTIVKQ